MLRKLYFIFYFFPLIVGCSSKTGYEVKNFRLFENFELDNDTLRLSADLDNAVEQGISYPSQNRDGQSYFVFSFEVVNNTGADQAFYYKCYYHNISYKFDLAKINYYGEAILNASCSKNFYGSWDDSSLFRQTKIIKADGKPHVVRDSIRIVGNPRNESKFQGKGALNFNRTLASMEGTLNAIQNSEEWSKDIERKAFENKIDLEEQRIIDCLFYTRDKCADVSENNRWQANPRVGKYEFMVVVASSGEHKKIPEFVKDLSKKEKISNEFVNPFYFFRHHPQRVVAGVTAQQILSTSVSLESNKGIFVDQTKFMNYNELISGNKKDTSDYFYKTAHFEQIGLFKNRYDKLNNIVAIEDIINSDLSYEDFITKYKTLSKKALISFRYSDVPGSNLSFNENLNAIEIANPKSTSKNLKKESTGIESRIGLTYGKYTGKIQFPKIINRNGIWNGLSLVFGLTTQSEYDWNGRTSCKTEVSKSLISNPIVDTIIPTHSSIKMDIAKTNELWPKTSYSKIKPNKKSQQKPENLVVMCSNYDMACSDPNKFNIGVHIITTPTDTFYLHRWDHWSPYLNLKKEIPAELISEIAYFEIEWTPQHIKWRLGNTPDNLELVGYVTSEFTTIPDNQMIVQISQEFLHSKWWLMSPYKQELIPFPAQDLKGYIYDVKVE